MEASIQGLVCSISKAMQEPPPKDGAYMPPAFVAKGFENGVCLVALDGQCSIDVELGYGRQKVQHKISKDC